MGSDPLRGSHPLRSRQSRGGGQGLVLELRHAVPTVRVHTCCCLEKKTKREKTKTEQKTEQKIDKKKRKRKREKRKTRKGEKEEKRKRRKDEKRKRRKEKKKKRQKKRKKRKDKNRTKAKNCYMIPNKITQAQHFLSGTSFANILRKIFYEQ